MKLNPTGFKNKGEVIASINTAQALLDEAITPFEKSVTRETLDALLLSYVERSCAKAAPVAVPVPAAPAPAPKPVKVFTPVGCTSCAGTGVYAPTGGACYRCTGKGYQSEADQKRNYGYDLHHPRAPAPAPAAPVPAPVPPATQVELDEDDLPF